MPDGIEADPNHDERNSDGAVDLHHNEEGDGEFDPEGKSPEGLPKPCKKFFKGLHDIPPWNFVTMIGLPP